jgi:hypothetical protein
MENDTLSHEDIAAILIADLEEQPDAKPTSIQAAKSLCTVLDARSPSRRVYIPTGTTFTLPKPTDKDKKKRAKHKQKDNV